VGGIAKRDNNGLRGRELDRMPFVAAVSSEVDALTGEREVHCHVAVSRVEEVNGDWSEPRTAALTRELQLPMLRTIDCPENAKLTQPNLMG
jgi:hypothetical protein